MVISSRLSRKLQQTLGNEAAEDLVNWMQQVDAQRGDFTALRHEIQGLRQETQKEIQGLRQEMQSGFAELRQEMGRLETKLEQRTADLIKWSFVFWVGAVGAIALLAGVLR